MNTKRIIDSIKRMAQGILPPGAQLILFGSRAKGLAHDDSDWDIMIVLDKPRRTLRDIDEFAYPFRELGWTLNAEINPIIATREDLRLRRHQIPLYNDVFQQGIVLWG